MHKRAHELPGNSEIRIPTHSSEVIEEMIDAMCGAHASGEEREAYREALQGLVRLAQAEQLLSMQLDFHTLTSGHRLHF